jgi:hypothetical protein
LLAKLVFGRTQGSAIAQQVTLIPTFTHAVMVSILLGVNNEIHEQKAYYNP